MLLDLKHPPLDMVLLLRPATLLVEEMPYCWALVYRNQEKACNYLSKTKIYGVTLFLKNINEEIYTNCLFL